MEFVKIDPETWPRREYFEHYFSAVPCTYSITVKLDITPIRARKQKLYPAMLYYLTTVVNRHPEFRTALDEAGRPGVYSRMNPLLYRVPPRHRDLLGAVDRVRGGL